MLRGHRGYLDIHPKIFVTRENTELLRAIKRCRRDNPIIHIRIEEAA